MILKAIFFNFQWLSHQFILLVYFACFKFFARLWVLKNSVVFFVGLCHGIRVWRTKLAIILIIMHTPRDHRVSVSMSYHRTNFFESLKIIKAGEKSETLLRLKIVHFNHFITEV